MTDRKRKISSYEVVFESVDSKRHIAEPAERIEEKFQRVFSSFFLTKVLVNFNDIDKVLRKRDANDFVIAEFVDSNFTINIAYSTSGDGGFHESTKTCTVSLSETKTDYALRVFNLTINHGGFTCDEDQQLCKEVPFLSMNLEQKLAQYMPFITSLFTGVVSKLISEKARAEESKFEYDRKDYDSLSKYIGKNAHGITMQILDQVRNFLQPFMRC